MFAEKRAKDIHRDAAETRERDMRMKGAEVRLEASAQDGILQMFMQSKEVGMSVSDPRPEHARTGASKSAHASNSEKE